MAQEHGLLTFLDGEVHIVEQYGAVLVYSLQTLHLEDLRTGLTLHGEDDARILTGRGGDLLYVQFLQHLLS